MALNSVLSIWDGMVPTVLGSGDQTIEEIDLFDDDIFDFDFSDGDFDFSVDSASTGSSGASANMTDLNRELRKKVMKAKRGSQFMKKKPLAPTKPSQFISVHGSKPNVSRRNPTNTLYAFPHFDKSDSLIYFTHSLSRHLNTGDTHAVNKLFATHLDKKCNLSVGATNFSIPLKAMLEMFAMSTEMSPDCIMCVHHTKVVENQIISSAYVKYTECQTIFDSVLNTVADPFLRSLLQGRRENLLLEKNTLCPQQPTDQIDVNNFKEESKSTAANILTGLVVHKRVTYVLTFDAVSKKVTGMNFLVDITSTLPVLLEESTINSH